MYPNQLPEDPDFLGSIRKEYKLDDTHSDVELLHRYVGGLLS